MSGPASTEGECPLGNIFCFRLWFELTLRQNFFVLKFTFQNARPQIFEKNGCVLQPRNNLTAKEKAVAANLALCERERSLIKLAL